MKYSNCSALTSFLLALLVALPFKARALDQTSADALAQSMLAASARHCAIISVPRCGSGELVLSFWNKVGDNSHLIVDGFEGDATLLASAQQKANALGLLGRSLYLRSGTLSTIAYSMPYADHFVDLVAATGLADGDLAGVSYAEMERVLCVGGQAWVGRAAAEGAGLSTASLNTWISGTHALSTATVVSDTTGTWAVITKISRLPNTYEGGCSVTNAGNRFFGDYVASWPALPQWTAKPYGGMLGKHFNWGILAKICVGGGRMYGFDNDKLCGLRAQSGILLWQRPGLSMNSLGGIQPFSKGLVYDNQIIDGETGVTTGTIPLPTDWTGLRSYLVDKDILYAVGRSSGGINTLLAYDLVNRATVYSQANFADNKLISTYYTGAFIGTQRSVVMAGGKLYTNSDTSVYCYNTSDGSKAWGPVTAPASIYSIQASPNGVLLQSGYSGTVNYYFLAVANGALKWGPRGVQSAKGFCDIAKISSLNNGNETICTICNGTFNAVDLLTGTDCGNIGYYGGGSCGPGGSITPTGTFARRGGITYCMPPRTYPNRNDPFASDCTDSPCAASGMIIEKDKWYNCSCYGLYRGTTALSPLGAVNPEQTAVQSERLQQGPAYGNVNAQVVPDSLDWPTHRANNNRSGYVPVSLPTNKCVQLWKYNNPTPNAYDKNLNDDFYTYHDVTPLVTAGSYTATGKSYTYLAGSDGVVKCLDTATGNLVWSYPTGAWVFATPTVANGCVYVGSGDGYAYCLEAHTGRLVWKFRAAPAERRFNFYGHLISTWPILTGVLVHPNGNAYFVSGMLDQYGVQVYAVNAQTGAIVWQNTSAGVCVDNRPGLARVGHMSGGYMTVLGNQLIVKEGARGWSEASQRWDVYDLQTGAISSQDTTCPRNVDNVYNYSTCRQIGLMGNYLIGWGENIYTEMEFEQADGFVIFSKMDAYGNPVRPFLVLNPNITRTLTPMNCMVWDDTEAYWDVYKYELDGITGLKQSLNNNIANPPLVNGTACTRMALVTMPSQTTDSLWKPASLSGTNRATALTTNCLVEMNTSGTIGIMDRTTGARYFSVATGGEPYLQGMAVDRSGKILAVNRNGDVVCFGTPDPVVVTQPKDAAGVSNGQSATFSVEVAGSGLSYQWRFNGVNIDGATGSTYTVASVSDATVGAYDVLVTNASGSVTTNTAVLSTAVTTSLTSPANGSTFSQPNDGQNLPITLSATASSLRGTIAKVEFYQGTTLLGTSTTAPYNFTWPAAPGTYTLTCKAYDNGGATATSQPVNITVAALILHYPLSETSGTTAQDTSGSGNKGALSYYGTGTPFPTWTPGIFDGGLHIDSILQGLVTGSISALKNNAFTASFWLNYDATMPWGTTMFHCQDTPGNIHSYLACMPHANAARLNWFTTSGTKVEGPQEQTITPGVSYHYAIVVTSSEVDWYINGTLFSTMTPPAGQQWMSSYKNFTFGNARYGNGASAGVSYLGTPGMLDEVRMYDRTLSATDIMALYTSGTALKQSPPTISLTNPPEGAAPVVVTATNSATLTANTTGHHFPLTVKYYANGTLVGSTLKAPYSFVWNNVARGTYTVSANVTDSFGQTTTSGTGTMTFAYVTAPTLNLAGGTYLNAQNVVVTCTDASASIYYTTDGSDPTTSSTLIASGSSILINKATMLKVRAFKSGVQPSEIQSVIYRIGNFLTGGSAFSMMLNPGASPWAWGWNYNGQLGTGGTTQAWTPVCVNVTNVVSIAAGATHGLAVKSDGSVWAWGYNSNGQVGDGSTTQRNAPVQVSATNGLLNAISVSAGYSHSLAVKIDGTVWAWGNNQFGQLGNSGTTQQAKAVQSGTAVLANMTAVAGGYYHSLALKNDGSVWAWGYNYYGQLGTGGTTNALTPVQVTGLSGTVVAIASHPNANHSLALKSDGTVWAWGYNYRGQLGSGGTTNSVAPVQVVVSGTTGLSNVIAIAAGSNHSLALKSDGTVWAWGYNSSYQLGDGSTAQRNTPVQASGLSNVVAIGAGQNNSLASKSDGSLWEWGYNGNGELGTGSTTTVTVPTAINNMSSPCVVFTSGSQTQLETSGTIAVMAQLFTPATVDVTVPFTLGGTAVQGTDYTISGTSVTIPAGQTSAPIVITPINDSTYKGNRTITVTMGTPTPATNVTKGTTTVHTVTISDDDSLPTVSFTTASQSKCENTGTANIVAQLSAACGVQVSMPFSRSGTAISGTDYTISATPLIIPAGQTSGTITAPLIYRSGYQGDRTLIVNMSAPTNATLGSTTAHTLTITDADPKPISITTPVANRSVPWGQPATFSVVVDGFSPTYQWRKNGTPISGATNASYTTPPTVVADNGAVFSVVATNAANSGTSSAALTVICNPLPAVNIFYPADEAILAMGDIQIKVNTDSPALAKVEFFQGTTKLGETNGDPFTWGNVPAGRYLLTAKATDNQGQTTTSTLVSITVNAEGYAAWLATYGLTGPDALETANPAKDKVPNLTKYALGLCPTTPCNNVTDGITPGLPLVTTNDTTLSITYQKDTLNTDIDYTVETSTDLVTWNTGGGTEETVSTNGTIQTIKSSIPRSSGRMFMRLRVIK